MESISELKRICGKPAHSRKAKSYREISYYFTWILIQFNLTANQVSILGVLFGMLSAICFITNNYSIFILGSILLFISELVDYSDGEVARYRRYKEMPDELFRQYGGFFDSLNHLSIPLIFFCMSFSFMESFPSALIIGFISASFRLLNTSFYYWVHPLILLFKPNYKKSKGGKLAGTIVVTTYSALLIPFVFLFSSVVDFYCNCGLTFIAWIFFFIIGGLVFMLRLWR